MWFGLFCLCKDWSKNFLEHQVCVCEMFWGRTLRLSMKEMSLIDNMTLVLVPRAMQSYACRRYLKVRVSVVCARTRRLTISPAAEKRF